MVSERPFGSQLSGGDVAFKDVFGMGGDFKVNCFALHKLHRLLSDEARYGELVHVRRQGHGAAPYGCGIASEGHGDLQFLEALRFANAVVMGAALVGLPVHSSGVAVENLHAVDPDVSASRLWVSRHHQRESDVTTGVVGPALQGREYVQVNVFSCDDHILARSATDYLGLGSGD